MADTQHLNQIFFGLDALHVVSRDGEKARIRGTFGLFAPEYDEYPWAFEVPRHYKSVRVFTRGLVKRLEVECRLSEASAGTDVDYALDVETIAGPIGFVAALIVLRRLEAGLARARRFLDELDAGALPAWPPANPQREAVALRARAIAIDVEGDDEKRALARLIDHVADAPDPDVARMRPYELADGWNLPRRAALALCLKATRAGLLRLSWDLLCPSCEAPSNVSSLKDLPQGGHCEACDIDFTTSFEQNVEATFSPEPSVRAAERLVFCHGSPSSTRSWLAQFVVAPHDKHELKLRLGAGRYRVQSAGIAGNTLVEVVSDGTVDTVPIAIESSLTPSLVNAAKAGEVRFVVENRDVKPRRVQLAHRSLASKAATAADVTALGLFRELFGNEALARDQHLAVGNTTILFTDLCGSTAMYEKLGDAAAYGLVREHFRALFAAIERERGRVVKTVGDCVMAAFDAPVDAVRAARGCIVGLRATEAAKRGALQLKVGVHAGPCLAVDANGQVDYFGRTVNIAARIESLAGPDEMVLSWSVFADREARAVVDEIARGGDVVTHDKRAVKGVDGEVEVVRIEVKK
jgi:class 3 adenylate cyclase